MPVPLRIAINERLFSRLNSKLSGRGGNILCVALATREELEGQRAIGLRDLDLQVGVATPEQRDSVGRGGMNAATTSFIQSRRSR